MILVTDGVSSIGYGDGDGDGGDDCRGVVMTVVMTVYNGVGGVVTWYSVKFVVTIRPKAYGYYLYELWYANSEKIKWWYAGCGIVTVVY